MSSYADDLICLPLVLSSVVWVRGHLLEPEVAGPLPLQHGLLTLVFFALYFEILLPHLKSGAVADPLDVVMYCVGFGVFHWGLNRSRSRGQGSSRREYA